MEQGGSIPIDRADPSPSSIKTVVDVLRNGEIILIFPSGTRGQEGANFKRGAATIALHAQVPIVPAFYQGPKSMHAAHLMRRPRLRVSFAPIISTEGLPIAKNTAMALTQNLQAAIEDLRTTSSLRAAAA